MVSPSNIAVVATGPHGFPGAQQIMSEVLRALSSAGCAVTYVGKDTPFLFRHAETEGVRVRLTSPVHSDAIGNGRAVPSQDTLGVFALAETMADVALEEWNAGACVVLWGTYLFPYGIAALTARQIVSQKGCRPAVWVTAAGSDVWQIGRQLPLLSEMLLSHREVRALITYSERFASEIRDSFGIDRRVECICPMLDLARFRPFSRDERGAVRRSLGIPAGAFVISSHSNMRPVKAPEDVRHIARAVASRLGRATVLLSIGPKVYGGTVGGEEHLGIVQTGVVGRVEDLLAAADAELNCSWHDSFNLSLAEAMACGLPCVSTDVVGIGPEIDKSGGGMLFPYEPSGAALAPGICRYQKAIDYLIALAESNELRRETGRKAAAHARDTFARSRVLPRYMKLLADTAGCSESA